MSNIFLSAVSEHNKKFALTLVLPPLGVFSPQPGFVRARTSCTQTTSGISHVRLTSRDKFAPTCVSQLREPLFLANQSPCRLMAGDISGVNYGCKLH